MRHGHRILLYATIVIIKACNGYKTTLTHFIQLCTFYIGQFSIQSIRCRCCRNHRRHRSVSFFTSILSLHNTLYRHSVLPLGRCSSGTHAERQRRTHISWSALKPVSVQLKNVHLIVHWNLFSPPGKHIYTIRMHTYTIYAMYTYTLWNERPPPLLHTMP